jgi:hypothetical protein
MIWRYFSVTGKLATCIFYIALRLHVCIKYLFLTRIGCLGQTRTAPDQMEYWTVGQI